MSHSAPAPFHRCGCCGATFATREAFLAGTEPLYRDGSPVREDATLGLLWGNCLSCPRDYIATLAVEVQS